MDCSPQAPPSMGFSRQEYWSVFYSISFLQRIFPQGLNLSLLYWQEDSLPLAMVETRQISGLWISKRTRWSPNYDSHGMGVGAGSDVPSRGPLTAEAGGSPPPPSDHIPSQQPGGAGVLRSEASAQCGLLQQSSLRARPRPGPGLSELHSGPEAPPKGLPALLAPLTPSTCRSQPRLPSPSRFLPSIPHRPCLPQNFSLPGSFSASTS